MIENKSGADFGGEDNFACYVGNPAPSKTLYFSGLLLKIPWGGSFFRFNPNPNKYDPPSGFWVKSKNLPSHP